MSMIIKNGTIVTATDTYKGDIEIKDEMIVKIAESIEVKAGDEIIDAAGQYVLPGGIDPHTHIGHPDYVDNFEDGSRAAAAGGLTTIGSYLEPPTAGKNLLDTYEMMKNQARDSYIDYVLNPIISGASVNDFLENAGALKKAGIGTIKLFMASRGMGYYSDDIAQYKMIQKAAEHGINVCDHCENGDVIDTIVAEEVAKGNTAPIYHGLCRKAYLEGEATRRFLSIVKAAGGTGRVVHISCKDAVDELAKAKAEGMKVVGETCPQYLLKDISYLEKEFSESAKCICAPPLREKWHQEVLWNAIRDGIITTVGSDHAPVAYEGMPVSKVNGRESFNKIPMGCPGVEDIYSVMYSEGVAAGRISLQTFVAIMSTNPAKEYGLYPKKGSITVGGDGDIVILDPNRSRTISVKTQYQKCDFNAYEGKTVQGVITHVVSRGSQIVRNGKIVGEKGHGKFLPAGNIQL